MFKGIFRNFISGLLTLSVSIVAAEKLPFWTNGELVHREITGNQRGARDDLVLEQVRVLFLPGDALGVDQLLPQDSTVDEVVIVGSAIVARLTVPKAFLIDGSGSPDNGTYVESGDGGAFTASGQEGFANFQAPYGAATNPFRDTGGTARLMTTTAAETARATWTPVIPSSGFYTVQVSYTRDGSNRASDAHYVVMHSGGATDVLVNQERHGWTWVPIGRFWFEAGFDPAAASVALVNDSADRNFYNDVLLTDYVADDAGVYQAVGEAGSLLADVISIDFDDGSNGNYDANFPDVIAPQVGATICGIYISGSNGACVQADTGTYRVVNLGFPFETIYPLSVRAEVMEAVVDFFDLPQLFADGFESGDLQAWSTSNP